MKWYSPTCFFIATTLMVSASFPAVAADSQEEVHQLADDLIERADPALKAAGYLTIGHLGDDDQQGGLSEHRDARGQQERLAVGIAQVAAGQSDAESFLAEQLVEARDSRDELVGLKAHLSDDQIERVVDEALDEAEGAVRDEIFSFLALQKGTLYQNLINRLTADDEAERRAALEAVSATAGASTLEAIAGLADHHDADVRRQLLEIADAINVHAGVESAVVDLLTGLVGDTDQEIADGAARRLVRLGQQRGTDVLVGRLAQMEYDERVEALEHLLSHDAQADIDAIRPLIEQVEMARAQDEEREREWQLLYELAATDADDDLVVDLEEKFGSTRFEERIVSVRSLGRTGRERTRQKLLNGLGEGRADIRRYSARALGQLGDPDVLGRLQRALQSESDKQVRLELIEAVGQIRDPESANVLRFMVTDRDPDIRSAVVDALGEIGLPQSVQALEMLLQDRDGAISWNAFMTLLHIDPDRAERRLSSALRNPPTDFEEYIELDELTDDARDTLFEAILSHSTSRVYSVGVQMAAAHRDELLPVVRQLVTSSDLQQEQARRELVHLLLTEQEDDDLARFERIVGRYDGEPAAILAGWYLARTGDDAFEETFEYLVERGNEDDPSEMYVIARAALANME